MVSGHGEHHPVAPGRGDGRQPDARVAGGGLDNEAAGGQPAARSASSIIDRAARSFTLPAGFRYSSLASSRPPRSRGRTGRPPAGGGPDQLCHVSGDVLPHENSLLAENLPPVYPHPRARCKRERESSRREAGQNGAPWPGKSGASLVLSPLPRCFVSPGSTGGRKGGFCHLFFQDFPGKKGDFLLQGTPKYGIIEQNVYYIMIFEERSQLMKHKSKKKPVVIVLSALRCWRPRRPVCGSFG